MTNKFISLILSLLLIIGLMPIMDISVSAAPTVEMDDTFETYSTKEYNTDFTGTVIVYNSDSTISWSLGKNLSLKIKEMTGPDGKTTNAAELTVNSCAGLNNTDGSTRFQYKKDAATSGIYVQEFDVYITDNPIGNIYLNPIWIQGNKIGFGTASDECTLTTVSTGWHSVKAVTIIGDSPEMNVIGYLDGECVSYKKYSKNSSSRLFQLRGTSFKGYKTIILDNIKLWYNPDVTTAESEFNNLVDVSVRVNPTVNFSDVILDTEISEIPTISASNAIVTKAADSSAVAVNDLLISSDGKTLTVDIGDVLDYSTTYKVRLTGLKNEYDSIVPDYTFSFTTVEEPPFDFSEPEFFLEDLGTKYSSGTEITALEDGYIRASYSLTNNHDTDTKNALMFAVLRDGKKLSAIQYKEISVEARKTVSFDVGFMVDDYNNQSIEIYIWDSLIEKNALAPAYVISADGIN